MRICLICFTALALVSTALPAGAQDDPIDSIIDAADPVDGPAVRPVAQPATDAPPAPDSELTADEPAPSELSPDAKVSRAQFATAIEAREPIDSIKTLSGESPRVYFFSELVGLDGRTVMHRWEHDGQILAEVPFHVGGPRWRVYSSKNLMPGWAGQWTVSVVDSSGRVLAVDTFDFSPQPAETAREIPEEESGPTAPPAAPAELPDEVEDSGMN